MANENMNEEKDYMGMIQWNRICCGSGIPLFGSDIKSANPIEIRISKAYVCSDMHDYKCDYSIFGKAKPYISVMLSPIQWAEFLTSGNSSGVPCTLVQVDGKRMENVDEFNISEEFNADFKTAFEKTAAHIDIIRKNVDDVLASGKTMGKTQLKEISKALLNAKSGYISDIEYIKERFMEDMSSIVAKAKAEITAFTHEHVPEQLIKHMPENAINYNNNSEG